LVPLYLPMVESRHRLFVCKECPFRLLQICYVIMLYYLLSVNSALLYDCIQCVTYDSCIRTRFVAHSYEVRISGSLILLISVFDKNKKTINTVIFNIVQAYIVADRCNAIVFAMYSSSSLHSSC